MRVHYSFRGIDVSMCIQFFLAKERAREQEREAKRKTTQPTVNIAVRTYPHSEIEFVDRCFAAIPLTRQSCPQQLLLIESKGFLINSIIYSKVQCIEAVSLSSVFSFDFASIDRLCLFSCQCIICACVELNHHNTFDNCNIALEFAMGAHTHIHLFCVGKQFQLHYHQTSNRLCHFDTSHNAHTHSNRAARHLDTDNHTNWFFRPAVVVVGFNSTLIFILSQRMHFGIIRLVFFRRELPV